VVLIVFYSKESETLLLTQSESTRGVLGRDAV